MHNVVLNPKHCTGFREKFSLWVANPSFIANKLRFYLNVITFLISICDLLQFKTNPSSLAQSVQKWHHKMEQGSMNFPKKSGFLLKKAHKALSVLGVSN